MKKFLCVLTAVMLCATLPFSAVYASDNSAVTDDSVILFEDFETTTTIEKINKPATDDGISGVTIEKDEYGSKAAKIVVKNGVTTDTGFDMNFGPVTSGKVTISYKMRPENNSARLTYWGLAQEEGNWGYNSRLGFIQFQDTLYAKQPYDVVIADISNSNTYQQFEYVVDIDKENVDIYVDGVFKESKKFTLATGTYYKGLDYLKFNASFSHSNLGVAFLPTRDGDAVYWVDDISVSLTKIKVDDSSPKDKVTNVDIASDIKIDFTNAPDLTSAKNTTTILCNSKPVDKSLYNMNVADKTLTINFPQKLEYGSEYKVVLGKALASTEEGCLPIGKDTEITFTTANLFEGASNLVDGGAYAKIAPEIPISASCDIISKLKKPNGEEVDFVSGTMLTELGDYTLTLTGTDIPNNKTQTVVYNFKVVGDQPPEARDVKIQLEIQGDIKPDSTLKGSYTYYDVNDTADENKDTEKTTLKWYCADTVDGEYKEIVLLKNKETFPLTQEYHNKYFKFEVIPYSTQAPKEPDPTKKFESEPFAGYFQPVAKNPEIEGKVILGETLKAVYTWYDENNQTKVDADYLWYRSVDDGKTWTIIKDKEGNNESKETYVLTEADKDAKIRAGITPKKNTGNGVETMTEEIWGLMAPTIDNVKIKGDTEVGQTLYVTYSYYDQNKDDKEMEVNVEWYSGDSLIDSGSSLQLNKKYAGKSIYAVVKPVSDNFPKEGKAVTTDSVRISGSNTGNNVTVGGNTGSPSYTVKPSKPAEEENTPVPTPPTTVEFNDIVTHWAKDSILEMYKRGIVDGVGNNNFSPDTFVTRAQFAKMIAKIFTANDGNNPVNINDNDENAWYSEYINYVVKNGLMAGSNGNFRPNDYITREEICVVLLNGMKAEAVESQAEFADSEEISQWAKNAVDYAYEKGIIKGKGENVFAPKSNATRAECMVMLLRLLEMMEV